MAILVSYGQSASQNKSKMPKWSRFTTMQIMNMSYMGVRRLKMFYIKLRVSGWYAVSCGILCHLCSFSSHHSESSNHQLITIVNQMFMYRYSPFPKVKITLNSGTHIGIEDYLRADLSINQDIPVIVCTPANFPQVKAHQYCISIKP